jgi:hypothetical protein
MDIDTFRSASEVSVFEGVPDKCLPTTQIYKERSVNSRSTRDKSVLNKRFTETPGVRRESETLKLKKTKSNGEESGPAKKKVKTILEMTLGLA